jgi:hypothetical protein
MWIEHMPRATGAPLRQIAVDEHGGDPSQIEEIAIDNY